MYPSITQRWSMSRDRRRVVTRAKRLQVVLPLGSLQVTDGAGRPGGTAGAATPMVMVTAPATVSRLIAAAATAATETATTLATATVTATQTAVPTAIATATQTAVPAAIATPATAAAASSSSKSPAAAAVRHPAGRTIKGRNLRDRLAGTLARVAGTGIR